MSSYLLDVTEVELYSSSYTEADNSVVVTTDSIKNITYYLAKVSPHVLIPERFALHLGTHLVSRYAHIKKAFITVEQLRWTRIKVDNTEVNLERQAPDGINANDHTHSFYRDGDDKRVIDVEVDATAGKNRIVAHVTAGIKDLLVLKSTGSAFNSFIRDEYTTLVEVDDRILSTAIDVSYTFAPFDVTAPTDEKKLEFTVAADVELEGGVWDPEVSERARNVTMKVFADDESASVQATLYRMAQLVIAQNRGIQSVSYALPNKHYVPVDMRYIGVENMKSSEAEVFIPLIASGLITATISRK